MIEAHKAGLSNITRDELEAHYMAGGHVEKVVHALVSASKANIELSFQRATGIYLAGRDLFEAVQRSVNPKFIAVSYTHLDVYKRQGPNREKPLNGSTSVLF